MSGKYDVCLLLEGSYPYVSGGVSVWVHNLIKSLPELTFTAICILASSKEKNEIKYELPANFKDHQVIYVHDPVEVKRTFLQPKMPKQSVDQIRQFHSRIKTRDSDAIQGILDLFRSDKVNLHGLLHEREPWNFLLDLYNTEAPQDSFLDYFWTYRFTHLPIFRMLRADFPDARVYHCISTGYAGILGLAASLVTRRPMLLTEHGIYVKERKIEISQAEWIRHKEVERVKVERDLGTFQKFWIKMFESLGRLTYQYAERIITLYEGNRQLEIAEGADPDKIEIIPNGINLKHFGEVRDMQRTPPDPNNLRIGFIGRVVPIKDVKTFLRACKIVLMEFPGLKVSIIGPTDEDEEYYEECVELRDALALEDAVEFTGRLDIRTVLPELHLLVLTSISEAQPLVILEANCVGIPAVSSDVGASREMLEGNPALGDTLGPSGKVTKVADPVDTAEAIIEVCTDPERWTAMSEAGKARVGTYYREEDLNRKYLGLYREYLNVPDRE